MGKLAIVGGEPVRSPLKAWPKWPVATERAAASDSKAQAVKEIVP